LRCSFFFLNFGKCVSDASDGLNQNSLWIMDDSMSRYEKIEVKMRPPLYKDDERPPTAVATSKILYNFLS